MSEVNRILSAIDERDAHAAKELLPFVYKELCGEVSYVAPNGSPAGYNHLQ
jgi:hypothetical protein